MLSTSFSWTDTRIIRNFIPHLFKDTSRDCFLTCQRIPLLWYDTSLGIILSTIRMVCISASPCETHLKKLATHIHANKVSLSTVCQIQAIDCITAFLCILEYENANAYRYPLCKGRTSRTPCSPLPIRYRESLGTNSVFL